jgi:hypothetical protein
MTVTMNSNVAVDTWEPAPISTRRPVRTRRHVLSSLAPTPHPPWVEAMLASLEDDVDAACWPWVLRDTMQGNLPPLHYWQRLVAHFFFIVESFPKYMGLSLIKTTYGKRTGDASARRWLLQNMAVEAKHAEWYIEWMQAMGVQAETGPSRG